MAKDSQGKLNKRTEKLKRLGFKANTEALSYTYKGAGFSIVEIEKMTDVKWSRFLIDAERYIGWMEGLAINGRGKK